jgi:hypothetical protein
VQKSHDTDWVEKTICELQKLGKQAAVYASVVGEDGGGSGRDDRRPQSRTKGEIMVDHLRTVLAPFIITYDNGYIAHAQEGAEFKNCSSCQIEPYYKPLFDLSDREVEIVREYAAKYSIMRQCCGSQMSKYNRLRLHGCDISEYKNNKAIDGYPSCENYNLPEVELSFAEPLEQNGLRPPEQNSRWTRPGDCAASEEYIRYGGDFNGHKWSGECTNANLFEFAGYAVLVRLLYPFCFKAS